MGRICAFPLCFNREKRRRTVTFHRLPLLEPYRLRLWLMALGLDPNSPIESLGSVRICGEHFSPEDFRPNRAGKIRDGPWLKSTAVPHMYVKPEDTQSSPSHHPAAADQDMADETLGAPQALFAGVPYSTSVKQTVSRDSAEHPGQPRPTLQLGQPSPTIQLGQPRPTLQLGQPGPTIQLGQPSPTIQLGQPRPTIQPGQQRPTIHVLLISTPPTGEKTRPSTSGKYYALPPTQSYQTDIKAEPGQESLEHSVKQEISMDSDDVPSDLSFVPSCSTSTSTQTSGENEALRTWHERKWLVNESKLMQLFKTCHQCGGAILEPSVTTTGSLIRVNWKCTQGHSGQWSSCPDVQGMPENDLLVSASTLFTGAAHTATADWADLLNLQLPKKTMFDSIQSSYLIPVIDNAYKKQQKAIMEQLLQTQYVLKRGVHVSGDGKSDSTGFSAKYSTYSFVDDATDQIILSELVPVTEETSSAAAELIGFRKGLDYLRGHGVEVEVVTTDRSPSIKKMMQEDYPGVHHEFDISHVVEGLKKKLLAVSDQKDNRDLHPWIKSICNHLWYASATCGGDPDDLIKKWQSLLHHICGEHRWEEGGEEKKCQHDDLSPEQQRRKRWLRKDSPAFKTLSAIALDEGLLKDLRHTALFKHRDKLEAFHSSLQRYTQKREDFTYASMRACTQLAIMDHNEKVQREQASTSTGNPRFNVVYPTQAKEDEATKVQIFQQNLVLQVLQRRLDPTVQFKDQQSHVSVPPLPPHIVVKTEPDEEETAEEHAHHFSM